MDLGVIGAGSYIWYSAAGWQANVKLAKKEFAQRFNCKGGILEKGKRYTFEKNYRYGDQLYGGDALWYVLAKDKEEKVHKGMAL